MANRSPGSRTRRRARPHRGVAAPTPLSTAIRQVCGDLEAAGLHYALVGGLAVSARAEPRLTRDIDVAIAVDKDDQAEAILHALSRRRYRVVTIVEQVRTKRLATARLVADRVVVDLLFASCGIETEVVARAELLEILSGFRVPVAQVGHLIAMKLLARDDRQRPQDLDDIRALLAVADAAQRRLVVTAIKQITARKFSRGRNLLTSWRAVLAGSRGGTRTPGRGRGRSG